MALLKTLQQWDGYWWNSTSDKVQVSSPSLRTGSCQCVSGSQETNLPYKGLFSSALWWDWSYHVDPISLSENAWIPLSQISPIKPNATEQTWNKNCTPAHTSIKFHWRDKRLSTGSCKEYRWVREGSLSSKGNKCVQITDRKQVVVSPREWNQGTCYLGVTHHLFSMFQGMTSNLPAPKYPRVRWEAGNNFMPVSDFPFHWFPGLLH